MTKPRGKLQEERWLELIEELIEEEIDKGCAETYDLFKDLYTSSTNPMIELDKDECTHRWGFKETDDQYKCLKCDKIMTLKHARAILNKKEK